MTNCCKVCGSEARLKCSGCLSVFYCSKNCQILDWRNGHKSDCKPFEVKRNDKLGRFMVAARDIKAGEVLFREFAVVHGPKMLSHPICLGCHRNLASQSTFYRCQNCAWPLCSKGCETLDPHVEECKLMMTKGYKCPIKTNCSTMQSNVYCLIYPLRLLLLKRNQPKIFEKVFAELESHVDERISSGSYDHLKMHLVPFAQKLLGAKDFPERLILTAAAVLDNNAFEINMQLRGVEMGGLFLLSLILCHDCVPNTKHFVNFIEADVDIKRYQMAFQTTVPVKKGEMLTTTYTDTLKTTLERRRHLKQTKIFDCDCKRCEDPTENSTYGSSFLCTKTNCRGLIVSSNPLDNNSDWICEKCKSQYNREEITSKLNRLQSQLNIFIKKSPEQLEEFIFEHSKHVHGDHLTLVEVKYMATMMYGNVTGYQYKDLSENFLKRKIKLCQQVLDVYDKINPGESNQRANVVFELNCATIIQIKTNLNRNLIKQDEALARIEECKNVIEMCYDILMKETENQRIMNARLKSIFTECIFEQA